jgi:Bacterial SH3 domain
MTEQIGELKSNVSGGTGPVNIRSTASTKASVKVTRPLGTRVKVLEKTTAEGRTWYKVSYGTPTTDVGWVREDVIKILPIENPTEKDTRLYFETDKRQIRVYESGANVLMNVYNKQTQKTEISGVSTTKLAKDPKSSTEAYLATKDGRTYQASFIRRGATQLKITSSDNAQNIEPPETGFGAKGTEYQQQIT